MSIKSKIGPLILIQLTIIPVLLWLRDSSFSNPVTIYTSLGQVTALVGTTLLCLNFVMSSRFKPFESLFAGLNRMYIVHAIVGSLGFTFIVLHPIFLILAHLNISLMAAFTLIIPSLNDIPVLLGIMGLSLLMILIVLTLYIKLEYDTWKQTHRWMGMILVLGSLHAFLVGSTLSYNIPLKIYMFSMFALGIFGFLYKQFSIFFGINLYKFEISSVNPISDVVNISFKSADSKIFKYTPGQFAFFRFDHKGVLRQWHPFSISSAPNRQEEISIDVKSLGDFTETLRLLSNGTKVEVEGPFGRFSYKYFKNTKNIWIAGGIGVTPFLSMARSLDPASNIDVIFYYSVKDVNEAIHLDELKSIFEHSSNKLVLYSASDSGFLTADKIIQVTPDYIEREIFICGPPPMMNSLKNQFISKSVKKSRIHTEEFALN